MLCPWTPESGFVCFDFCFNKDKQKIQRKYCLQGRPSVENFLFSKFKSNLLALYLGWWPMHTHCTLALQPPTEVSVTSDKTNKQINKSLVALQYKEKCHRWDRNDKKFMDNWIWMWLDCCNSKPQGRRLCSSRGGASQEAPEGLPAGIWLWGDN